MIKKKIILFTIAIILAIWGGVAYFLPIKSVEPIAVLVNTQLVKATRLPLEASAIGTLTARCIELTPEIVGHIDQILFQDGMVVKQGMPLIQLNDAVYRVKYESAKAQLDYSKNNYARMLFLGKQGAIAKQAIDQAKADLIEKQANARESEVLLQKTKIISPFDGSVGKTQVNVGDYVTVGQHLVTITDTMHLRVEYSISEKYLSYLKIGQPVTIQTSAYPNRLFTGKVAFIAPTINRDNRSILLYAEVSNSDHLLIPGLFVNITQILGEDDRAILIPARCLVPNLDGEQVFKILNNKAIAIKVTVGKRYKDQVQIIEGLVPGDRIVTDGQFKIKNGMSVKINT